MKATVRRYFRAAGSILDIAPATDYTKIVKKTSDMQAISNDFRRIGGDFGRAIVSNAAKAQAAK
ncbi:hypothetical protein ZW61_003737 [Salmonella enterica subsp. houtenae]|uniref:Uncharacterized protein n=1 Tax=Salmonella enterica TaxID=28901 RepID=A0A747Y579_SALER|nr:hypothetical protein [Salmonella enterica subsp. enterica serovar Veneziana]EBP1814561.1 hypothetical protein [Salmonella enterica]EBR0169438.1 hypothetical protein [Salmonella enterica subsp. enterica serovar Mikawasima]EBU9249684.1 hypothetical protein [Salmonella enterica subsp. enterica serovar Oslo]EBV2339025.1 hypothetical protein [Salmonella enterica subsp. enterica serovar Potsdam]EBV3454104.1 hypothetical protein [Salmonella enterica subsp. enterica serovar Typhimurium]EBV3643942.